MKKKSKTNRNYTPKVTKTQKYLKLFSNIGIVILLIFSALYIWSSWEGDATSQFSEHSASSQFDGKLEIKTSNRALQFNYELASTPSQQSRGLMYRQSIAEDYAMIFSYNEAKPRNMWMKNTYIPLDMLFIDENNTISHIHTNAEPHSEDIISSQGPAKAVIEVKAGIVNKYGIKQGDLVKW